MSVLVVIALVQLFSGVWNAPGLSLGQVAVREAARRASLPASVRALTDADIGPPPPRSTPAPAIVPPAAAAPEAVVPKAADPAGAASAVAGGSTAAVAGGSSAAVAGGSRNEAWWRARITQARVALERDRVLVAALESRVAALTTDVANRADPAQRAVLMNDRVRALAELDRMRDQVDAGMEAIAAIEEDARKAGIPAGWIR